MSKSVGVLYLEITLLVLACNLVTQPAMKEEPVSIKLESVYSPTGELQLNITQEMLYTLASRVEIILVFVAVWTFRYLLVEWAVGF